VRKTIYLHIGFGKTGTTSIQKTLLKNYDKLLSCSVLYPKTGIVNGGHHGLAILGLDNMTNDIKNQYKNLIQEIELSNCQKVILSSENFCFMKPNYIDDFFNLFKDYNVEVIFYIRNQVDLIKSTYLEWVKVGRQPIYQGIKDFWNIHKNSFIFQNRLDPFLYHYDKKNIHIYLFSKQIVGKDVVKHFLKSIQVDSTFINPIEKFANDSLIEEFIELANNVNQVEKNIVTRQNLIGKLVELSVTFKNYSKNCLITKDFEKDIQTYYYKSNKLMAEEYLDSKAGIEF